MTRLGWFECLILVAFFFSALAAFLTGGMKWLGYVAQAFFWTAFLCLARQLYLESRETILEEIRKTKTNYHRTQAFNEWANRRKTLKGME